MSRMMVARPKPVQIQQAIVMQWLKPDLQDHSHVYSSLNDDGDGDDHDDHHHHQLNWDAGQFHFKLYFIWRVKERF